MLLAKNGVTQMTVLGALVCSLLVFDASAAAADWDVVLLEPPIGALGVAPPAQSLARSACRRAGTRRESQRQSRCGLRGSVAARLFC